ncbi:hypothetical protein [Rhodohalobacter sp. 614A]|uniref:hypothetical protein n=1 Tax=Rhodohalobacter sp. 614A TaxID=2908649 RepID=UPI001F1E60A9|nr:hypothetical protein [Rhodohalobacter sp. 614A]
MSKNTLFLHIGTHKTGSTTIQKTLEVDSNFEDDIIYLGRHKQPIIQIAEENNASESVVDELTSLIESGLAPYKDRSGLKFILSNEKLAGDKRDGYKNSGYVAKHLKNILDDFNLDVKVVVYFRRQDDFVESLFSQRIYNGSAYTFQQFIDRLDNESFSWKQVADSFAQHFGKENILVRRYHQEFLPQLDSIIHDFGKTIGSELLQKYSGEKTYNEGYTNSALKVIELVNPHLDRARQKSIKKLLRKQEQRSAFNKYSLFKPEQRKEFLDHYSESNAGLAKEYLGIQSGVLFPPIESDYSRKKNNGEVDEVDIAVNFSLAFHHLYQETKRLNQRIKELEERPTFSQKVVRKLKRLLK